MPTQPRCVLLRSPVAEPSGSAAVRGGVSVDENVLVRSSGGPWSSPARRGFGLEQELEALIHAFPEVLPGVSPAALAVDQFVIPGGGSVDLVVLEADASITVVECKLAKNAEARRTVVGQILSYAASIAKLDADAFLARFDARLSRSAIDALAPEAGAGEAEDWDESRFRHDLARTLADGAFRLVIAVDRITEELRSIVEYLNTRTDDSVEVLALELDLVAQDGIEVLIPRVHGLESARLKTQRSGGAHRGSRDVGPVLDAFDVAFTPDVRARIDLFIDDLRSVGGFLQQGTGANPAVSGYLRTSLGARSLWSLTLDPGPLGGPQFFFNVRTWVEVFGQNQTDAMLDRLAEQPTFVPIRDSVRDRGVEKLHRIRIIDAFGSDAAVVMLREVMKSAMQSTQDG
jgi:hypothetical protein